MFTPIVHKNYRPLFLKFRYSIVCRSTHSSSFSSLFAPPLSGLPKTPSKAINRALKSSLNMSTSGKQNDAEWTVEKAIPSSLTDQIISASSEPEIVLCFLSIIHLLKAQRRTGWIVRNIESAESIADHMYRMSIITFLIKDSNVDKNRMAKIAIVHDMAEAIVGDITPTDPVPKSEKHRRELASMVYLSKLIEKVNPAAAEELMHLWLEYENIASLEARYVKDIDKYELMVQALDYEKRDNCSIDLSDLYSVRNKIETAEVASWADEVLHQRRKLWNECKGINPPSNSK